MKMQKIPKLKIVGVTGEEVINKQLKTVFDEISNYPKLLILLVTKPVSLKKIESIFATS